MKHAIAYSAYFLIAAIVTYFAQLVLSYMIGGILFYAADAPPGDISGISKTLYSIGIPIGYALVLFGFYCIYSQIVKNSNVHLRLSIGGLFHVIIAIYLIWNLVPVVL